MIAEIRTQWAYPCTGRRRRPSVPLTGGCPYPEGGGELVAIDESRTQRTVVDDLNMPIDVALGPDGTLWVLEFATFTADASCFSGMGYQQNSGRLRPDP